MTYLLDTNACIQILKSLSYSPVVRRLVQYSPDEICICAPVEAELFYGAFRSAQVTRNLQRLHKFCDEFKSLPFSSGAAQKCGEIRSQLAAIGQPIGPYDLQIAAIALVHDLILVTHNVKEFERVEGLTIEDWETVP